MKPCIVLAVLAVAGAPVQEALAAESPADTTPSDAHLRGLELSLMPGFGGAPSDSPVQFTPPPNTPTSADPGALLTGASPWSRGFVGKAMLGWRAHPLMSGGLRAGLRTATASALADGSTDLSRTSWDAGLYARVYPLGLNEKLRRFVDPWISVGVEYMRDTQSFSRPAPTSLGTTVVAKSTINHHAVGVPIGVGVDYRLLPMLSVGPAFEYAVAVPVAACMTASASGFPDSTLCSSSQPGQSVLSANGYGVWSAGLDLRLTLF